MINIKHYRDLSEKEIQSIIYRKGLQFEKVWEETIIPMVHKFENNPYKTLIEFNNQYDGFSPEKLIMEKDELKEKYDKIKAEKPVLLDSFEKAIENITEFHQKQMPSGFEAQINDNLLGLRFSPFDRVALYVPGGKANYPTTVMMGVIPAKIAGVKEIILLNPPSKESKDTLDLIAAIAYRTGADKILKSGGAQSILAAAYGVSELNIEPVDFIYGPGNKYVASAKNFIFSRNIAGIDSYAGPSEVVIIADKNADPCYLAHDLMAQAEHDEDAIAILLTDDEEVAKQTREKIESILIHREKENTKEAFGRVQITRDSIERNGILLITENLDDAVRFSNRFAPEHLEIQTCDNDKVLMNITSAGSVFVGEYAPVAIGDYYSGTNHILPTGGAARFSSGVSVHSFFKRITYQKVSRTGLKNSVDPVTHMSRAEDLYDEHGYSIVSRFKENPC